MRIRELNLIRYGKFTDRSLQLPLKDRDIHLIVGPNEAGKSTVRSAIGDWLFGIPMRTPLAFLHPMPELRIGGVIERRPADGSGALESLAFDRTKGNKNTLRAPGDEALPDGVLQSWLGGLQAQAFARTYALDHTTLVEGGAGILSAADDIGRMLFQSASGLQHLGGALQQIQADADVIWAPRKSGAREFYKALEAHDAAVEVFKQARLRTRDWQARHEAMTATEARLTEAKAQDLELRQQLSRLERIRRVRPLLLMLDSVRAQRTELLAAGEIPLLDEDAATVFAGATQEIALADADIARLQRELVEIEAHVEGTIVDRDIIRLADDITELNERRLQFRAHRTDMVKRAEEIRLEWIRVQELARGLGWRADSESAIRERLAAAPLRARLAALLKSRAPLALDLKNAGASLSERERQIRQAELELSQVSEGAVDTELAWAVEQAMRLGDHEKLMAELQGEVEAYSLEIETAMAGLGTWRRPLEALRDMLVPETSHIQGLIEHQRAAAAEEKGCREALEARGRERAQLDLDLQQFVRNFQPVSREQVLDARGARDASWQAIRQSPLSLPDRADGFEALTRQADQLADDRLARAQHEADRQARSDALEHKRRECQDLEQRLQSVERRKGQRMDQWEALAVACGLPALPLEMALVWLESREAVLDRVKLRSSAEARRLSLQSEAAQIRDLLWGQLNRGSVEEPAPGLSVCLRQARALMSQADQAQGQRKALEQQVRAGQRSLGALQEALETAQGSWAQWQQSWQAAVQSVGYGTDVSFDQVEAEIEVMGQIEQLLDKIRRIRSERIETMQADLDGLAVTASSLAARVAPELTGQTPEAIALELVRRLDQAQRADEALREWLTRLTGAQTDLAGAQTRLHSVQARLAPWVAAAGAQDVTALGRAIERSDARRAIESRIRSAEQDLAQAADGLSTEDLRKDVNAFGADELRAELERMTAASGEAVERIASLGNAFGAQKIAFDALDGTDQAARAEAERQEAIAAMADCAERYLRLQTAARLLKWSIEKFRETRQGPMLAKASERFKGLTMGSFSRLLVDSEGDTPRLSGIRPTGEQVDVTGMSEGSRDQLYLALRLAALELQVEQGFALPLIADDLFINFDDPRTAAGLKVLGELSRRMQVVFLTHHDHLVPLAREVLGDDLNVVAL